MTNVIKSLWRDEVVQAAIEASRRQYADLIKQGMWNNLFDNNPGELDRWADDGGR